MAQYLIFPHQASAEGCFAPRATWAIPALMATFFAFPAVAQQYLPQADMATCLARSATQCQALGCQPGTTYWWACEPLTDGTSAVTIDTSRADFAAIHPRGPGLNAAEQTALRTRAQMSTKLRDIIASGAWLGRLTQAQKDRITTFVSTRPALKTRWDAINAGADVDLQAPVVQAFIQALRAGNVVNDSDVTALNATQSAQ